MLNMDTFYRQSMFVIMVVAMCVGINMGHTGSGDITFTCYPEKVNFCNGINALQGKCNYDTPTNQGFVLTLFPSGKYCVDAPKSGTTGVSQGCNDVKLAGNVLNTIYFIAKQELIISFYNSNNEFNSEVPVTVGPTGTVGQVQRLDILLTGMQITDKVCLRLRAVKPVSSDCFMELINDTHTQCNDEREYRCTLDMVGSGICIPEIKLTHASFRHEPPLPGIFSLEATSTPKKKSVTTCFTWTQFDFTRFASVQATYGINKTEEDVDLKLCFFYGSTPKKDRDNNCEVFGGLVNKISTFCLPPPEDLSDMLCTEMSTVKKHKGKVDGMWEFYDFKVKELSACPSK